MAVPKPNQKTGPLAGHVKRGRKFASPIAATGVLNIADWIRDDFPDLLWPALVTAGEGTDAARRFVKWQKAVQDDLGDTVGASDLAEGLDGRLTSLDRLAALAPAAMDSIRTRALEFDLLSDRVVSALCSYPYRPALWLTDLDINPPGRDEVDLLAEATFDAITDGHREAILKCLYIWSAVQAQAFSTDEATIDLLKSYPLDERTRNQADSVVRASWGAHKGLLLYKDPDYFEASIKWARVFWGANSMTTPCIRKRDRDEDEAPDTAGAPASETPPIDQATQPGLQARDFRRRAMDLMASYIEAIENSPSRLYDQEREEVHTGLVSRTARDVIAVLGAPDLWCTEHGAHIGRTLAEIRILLTWMAGQDQAEIYRKYQDYGAGKAKLYALIAEELPAHFLIDGAREAIDRIKDASHNDEIFDYRVVDISSSFADGKSLRQMAEECDLLDLYRHTYQLESGVVHSEWWSVEIHAMERCLNVLHRAHLIPSMSLSTGSEEVLAKAWITALYGLVILSLNILNVPQKTIDEAFSWLNETSACRASGEDEDH